MGRLDVKTREFQTQRGEISKRNYYIISSRVLIKAIISERIQLEPSRTSGLCLGIMRHSCDNPHALFVRQPSAAKSCKKMGRWRRESDVSKSARRRHFIGSNQRALKKNNSRSDVSDQCESASRRTCKWKSWHPSRQGYFRQKCSHGMARQVKSSNFHMVRASPERRYGELWRLKIDVKQRCAKALLQLLILINSARRTRHGPLCSVLLQGD